MTAAMSVAPVSAAPRLPSAPATSSGRPAMASLPRECFPECGLQLSPIGLSLASTGLVITLFLKIYAKWKLLSIQ